MSNKCYFSPTNLWRNEMSKCHSDTLSNIIIHNTGNIVCIIMLLLFIHDFILL